MYIRIFHNSVFNSEVDESHRLIFNNKRLQNQKEFLKLIQSILILTRSNKYKLFLFNTFIKTNTK